MNDYDYQQFFFKGQKNPGTKLPAPLETLQKAFNMLKETEPFFGTQNDENYQARKLAGTKIFSFHKKTGPDWNRTSGIFCLKHGCYHCTKCSEYSLNL